MLDRVQLETFATVLECQNFRKAAKILHISAGAVTARVKSLEAAVGVTLLLREPTVTPTRAGEVVLRHVMAVRLSEEEAFRVIKPGEFPPVKIAVAVNADSLETWFQPVSWQLAAQHIGLEIIVDDQDHTTTSLVRGDVKGCISTKREPSLGFQADFAGGMRYRCVATPGFASAYLPKGILLPAILDVPAILFDRKDAIHDRFHRFLRIVELRERRRTISRALEKVRDVHGTGEFDEMFRISESRTDRGQAGMEPERTSAHGCGGQRQQHFARAVGSAAFV